MSTNLFKVLGSIAGLAGIAFGVLLLIFQGVLQQKFLPSAGLDSVQAYSVIMALMVLTFGIASVGVVAWLVVSSLLPQTPLPPYAVVVLAILLLAVLVVTVIVGSGARDRAGAELEARKLPPQSTPSPAPSSSQAAPSPASFTRAIRVCSGEYEKNCQPHDAYLYCYVDVGAWAAARCDKYVVQRINTYGGNKCGYSIDDVICTGPR
jgi:hypothetical protein